MLVGLASSIAGCSSHQDGQWRVCTDAQGRRLPDADCGNGSSWGSHAGWTYIGRSSGAPSVGEVVSGGRSAPAAGEAFSAPAEGIARGGFGGIGEALGHGFGHGAGE
jgi:hypothetical protein